MDKTKYLNTFRYPEISMKQLNFKLPDKLLAAAGKYAKDNGYRNIQELAAECLREKVFRKSRYDKSFSAKEIELIDRVIEKALSKRNLGTGEDLARVLK